LKEALFLMYVQHNFLVIGICSEMPSDSK